jgi:MFS family permease
LAVGLSRWLPLSLLMMAVAGVGFMVQMASSNTIIQTLVREERRGRVMAYYAMSFMGMAPFGSLVAGAVAGRVGAPWTIFGGGCICVLAAAFFRRQLPRLRELVRPIYVGRESPRRWPTGSALPPLWVKKPDGSLGIAWGRAPQAGSSVPRRRLGARVHHRPAHDGVQHLRVENRIGRHGHDVA